MKTLGILGGVGPETTSNFYLYIISQCQKFGDLYRPNILIKIFLYLIKLKNSFFCTARILMGILSIWFNTRNYGSLAGGLYNLNYLLSIVHFKLSRLNPPILIPSLENSKSNFAFSDFLFTVS